MSSDIVVTYNVNYGDHVMSHDYNNINSTSSRPPSFNEDVEQFSWWKSTSHDEANYVVSPTIACDARFIGCVTILVEAKIGNLSCVL